MEDIKGTAAELIDGVLTVKTDIPVYNSAYSNAMQVDTIKAGQSVQVFSYLAKNGYYGSYDYDCLQLYEADGSAPGFGTPRLVRIQDMNGNVSNVSLSQSVKDFEASIAADKGLFGLPSFSWSNWYWYLLIGAAALIAVNKLV